MARGDDLQVSAKGLIVLTGPPGAEAQARAILEQTLKRLFSDLNDPLVCQRFSETGIANKTATRISLAPWIRYKEIPRPEAQPFVPLAASTARLAELAKLIRNARGTRKAKLQIESMALARSIGSQRVLHARSEQERIKRSTPAARAFIKALDVKYRNPPNPQWKWWSKIVDETNTIAPGTFTTGP
jgi:hypothetical protein